MKEDGEGISLVIQTAAYLVSDKLWCGQRATAPYQLAGMLRAGNIPWVELWR
jgi:hypothetical protein